MDSNDDVVLSGHFFKEGKWVKTVRSRYFEISRDGHIAYKENKDAKDKLGVFDVSGRLACSLLKQTSGRRLDVILPSDEEFRNFCIAIAQCSLFNNLIVSF